MDTPLKNWRNNLSTPVTVHLPPDTYKRAERLAKLTSRTVADVLTDTLEISLPKLNETAESLVILEDLTDEAILQLTALELDKATDKRLSELLYAQQANTLTLSGQHDLTQLMQLYQEKLLRKAQALAEAVKRGLIPPLSE